MTDSGSSIELPTPEDDGAADHLPGCRLPAISLAATDGRRVRLDALAARSVVFVFPAIGGPPGDDVLDEWTALPGARGCTPEACSFRDELARFRAKGVDLFGLSSQTSASQRDHVRELGLQYPLLSDEGLRLSDAIALPTFDFNGRRYYRRLTLIIAGATIDAALYPVFPPEDGAAQALKRLSDHPPAT